MATYRSAASPANWHVELPVLAGRVITLREPRQDDCDGLVGLLSLPDATRFRLDSPPTAASVRRLIDRAVRDRVSGVSFTFVVRLTASGDLVGLIQVHQLEPSFETASWECTLAPDVRGTGVFWEAAHLVGSFAFATVGVNRLEARIDVGNARAAGALRKIGAVQEGLLRRSAQRGHEHVDQTLWAVLKDSWEYDSPAPRVVVH